MALPQKIFPHDGRLGATMGSGMSTVGHATYVGSNGANAGYAVVPEPSEKLGQELPSIARRRNHDKSHRARAYVLIVLVVLVAIGIPAYVLRATQNAQRSQLEERFRAGAPLTTDFVHAYVNQLERHQWSVARKDLTQPFPADMLTNPAANTWAQNVISQASLTGSQYPNIFLWPSGAQQTSFQRLVDGMGFQEASLLTDPGNIVLIASQYGAGIKANLLQADINATAVGSTPITGLPELRPSENPQAASQYDVTNLGSANSIGFIDDDTPVIEIASAFSTPFSGNRVLIGAYQLGNTPLSKFLTSAVPYADHEVFLVDKYDFVLACSDSAVSSCAGSAGSGLGSHHQTGYQTAQLASYDAALGKQKTTSGFYTASNGKSSYFAARTVPGTPWKLFLSVPTSQLFSSISGSTIALQWGMFAVYALLVIFAAELFHRFLQGRNKLQALTQELDLVSRLDPLTGIYNRRHLDDHLGNTISTVKRHNQSIALIIADVDHFKRVNDTYGHDSGDMVLKEVTARMMQTLRSGDLLGRWGGEEFLVILPMTSVDGAQLAGERMREIIGETPISLGDGHSINVTASFGCAAMTGEEADPDALLRRADSALYEAKETGRNKVVVSGESAPDVAPHRGPGTTPASEAPVRTTLLPPPPPVAQVPPPPPTLLPPPPPSAFAAGPPPPGPSDWSPPSRTAPPPPPNFMPPPPPVDQVPPPPSSLVDEAPPRPPRDNPPPVPPLPGWWLASDGNWYPPELHPAMRVRVNG